MGYVGGQNGQDFRQTSDSRKRTRRVYTTEIINKLIADAAAGYDIPMDPFYDRNLDLRASGIAFEMTRQEYDEYLKCYDDAEYFVSNYCKFMTDNGRRTVELMDFQKNVIRTVTEEKYIEELGDYGPKNRNVIWMAARQSGKTTTVCAFFSWMMIFHSERNMLIVANKEDTAKEIVDKTKEIFKGLPFFMKPGCKKFMETSIILENDSKILSSATTKSASIGFTIHCLLLDEFAHVEKNIVNSFWRSVYPTLSRSLVSQCVITSTPNGVDNKFYDIWTKSKEGRNSFVNIRTDYYEVPGHDAEWVEQMKADFGEEEFAQEFELQFNVNASMLSSASDIRFLDSVSETFVTKTITGDNEILKDSNLVWSPDFDPDDVPDDEFFIAIVDLAQGEGLDGGARYASKRKDLDFNTIGIYKVVLNSVGNVKRYASESCDIKDVFRFVQVGRWMSRDHDEEYAGRLCSALCFEILGGHSDRVKVMVEMNFNGKSFVNAMQSYEEFDDCVLQKTFHSKPVPGEKKHRKIGFKTGPEKMDYCIRGAKLVAKRRIIPRDSETVDQMKSFGYVKGKLKGMAVHDDLSMPVYNHVSRLLDDDTFIEWLGDIFDALSDDGRTYELNELIERNGMENPDVSDNDFMSMYGGHAYSTNFSNRIGMFSK